MITPQFEVSQDDDFVYVKLHAPYIKASMIQFEVAGEVFVFSLPPYYLRLRFPHELIEDDRMTSRYDVSSGSVECKVAKLVPGQKFEDLDMLTKLLATKRQHNEQTTKKPLIEELDTNDQQPVEDEDFDWDIEIEQELPNIQGLGTTKYGFDNRYSDIIGLSLHTGNEINEVLEPEKETLTREDVHRLTEEKFDFDHYIMDEKYDRENLEPYTQWQGPQTNDDFETLSGPEQDRVVKLGHRKHLVSQPREVYLALLQFIFGACYDRRTNTGDTTVESAWTVGKLVPSACFLFNTYANVNQVVIDCTARALSVPLMRQWDLTTKVWQDTLEVLRHGRRGCLKILARLLEVFESDLHFCYRQIWIDDLTVWIQYASDKVLAGLAAELEKAIASLTKKSLFIDLEGLEAEFIESQESAANASDDDDSDDSDDSDDDSDDESDDSDSTKNTNS